MVNVPLLFNTAAGRVNKLVSVLFTAYAPSDLLNLSEYCIIVAFKFVTGDVILIKLLSLSCLLKGR